MIDTAPQWVCSKHPLNDIHDNFTNQAALINDPHLGQGEKAEIKDTTLVIDGDWPAAAVAVMQNAGPQADYRWMLPVSGGVVFDTGKIDDGAITAKINLVRNLEEADGGRVFFDGGASCAGLALTVGGKSVTADEMGFAWLTDALNADERGKIDPLEGLSFTLSAGFPKGRNDICVGLAGGEDARFFGQSVSVMAGYKVLYSEDFESTEIGECPAGLTYDTALGKAAVEAGADGSRLLKVDHTAQSPAGSLLIQHTLPPTSGVISVELRVKPTSTKAAIYAPYIRSGTQEIVTVNRQNNGYVAINKPPMEYLNTYKADTWIEMRVMMDTSAGTFDLYTDGVLRKGGVPLKAAAAAIDNVCFGMYRFDTGSYYVDDFIIKAIS